MMKTNKNISGFIVKPVSSKEWKQDVSLSLSIARKQVEYI